MVDESGNSTNSAEPATELDAEAKRLKLEQTKAESRKAIAEAQKGMLAAQLPASEMKPLEGKVDVGTGVGLVGQLLTYRMLDDAATSIATEVKKDGRKIFVVDSRQLITSDWAYEAVHSQLVVQATALDDAMTILAEAPELEGEPGLVEIEVEEGVDAEEAATEAAEELAGARGASMELAFVPALTGAAAIVGAAASLVGMFRTDYSISAKEVAIGATPLVAAVAKRLLGNEGAVCVDGFYTLRNSATINQFWQARAKRNALERRCLTLKAKSVQPSDRLLEDLRAELKETSAAYSKALGEAKAPPNLGSLRNRLRATRRAIRKAENDSAVTRSRVAVAEVSVAQFDAFSTAVSTTAKEGEYPPLVAAAIREGLHNDAYTHVLFVGIEGSAAETITRKSFFRRSGQVGYMGGAEVSYLLLDLKSNALVAAGNKTLLSHLNYDLDTSSVGTFTKDVLGEWQ